MSLKFNAKLVGACRALTLGDAATLVIGYSVTKTDVHRVALTVEMTVKCVQEKASQCAMSGWRFCALQLLEPY